METNENKLVLLPINLQLFAEDDELDTDTDYEAEEDELDADDDVEDDETNYEDSVEEPDGEEEQSTNPAPKDKVTLALIKQKQANKALKQKLEAFEQEKREQSQKEKRKQIVDALIEKGYDEEYALEKADERIESESIKQTVKKLEFMTEHADVIAKYPDAKKNIDKLIKLQKATGWDIEKICRMEFEADESGFDSRVKQQQEARLKTKKKPSATPAGGQTPIQSTKLDPDDERAYQFYAKKNPGISRKQYLERLNQTQQIPHDKWE